MRIRTQHTLALVAATILACVSWGCSRSSRAATVDFGPKLSAAVEKARRSSSSDQISDILRDTRTVTLTGTSLVTLSRMTVLRNDELLVLDMFSRVVKRFSAQGQYEQQVGETGLAPGQYTTPTDISSVGNAIAIDDFTVHRINEYSANGSFLRSFVYSAQGFGSGRLNYFPKAGNYVLFGNKWLNETASPADRSADLANIYDHDGRYRKSVFEFPGRFLSLNLVADDTPETYIEPATDTLYFALPFEYKVYSLTPAGSTAVVLDEKPSKFREPTTPCDPKAGPEGLKAFQSWLLTWTPIVGVWKQGPYLMIEYQTFDPLRYTIDVRDTKNRQLVKQFRTNYRYLTSDGQGHDWFIKDLPQPTGQAELLAGRLDENLQ